MHHEVFFCSLGNIDVATIFSVLLAGLQTWLCSLIFKTITDHTLNHVIVLDKRVEVDRSQRNKLVFSATVLWILVFVSVSPLSFCNSPWWWFMAGWESWLNHWTERQVALPRPSPLYMAVAWQPLHSFLPVCRLNCPIVSQACSLSFCSHSLSLSLHAQIVSRENARAPMNLIILYGYSTTEFLSCALPI